MSGKTQYSKAIFEADPQTNDPLKVNEVEVQVIYARLNKEDIVIINGAGYPTTFSHRVYGRVINVREAVNSLRSGDNMFGLSSDKFSTFQRTSSDLVQKIDEKDRLQEVVTLPIAYATTLQPLGNLDADEVVLFLHGTGVCGIAALVFAAG